MQGQWQWMSAGPSLGVIIVEVDARVEEYEISLTFFDDDQSAPGIAAHFSAPKLPTAAYKGSCVVIDRQYGLARPLNEMEKLYPNRKLSSQIDVILRHDSGKLSVQFNTDAGINAQAEIPETSANQTSTMPATNMTWDQFQSYVRALEPDDFVFRGHERNGWRLRTSFHRAGRANLARYFREDVVQLHLRLSAITTDFSNLSDSLQTAAFLALLQHHGYPTPLLDWSRSPYIAAFFAFRKISAQAAAAADPIHRARVYILDQKRWNKLRWYGNLIQTPPHVSFMYPAALSNPRLIPQQGLTTISNVDDIEEYIIHLGRRDNIEYLKAIDIHWSERAEVIKDLRYMGITAGAMFPGIDGACEELKERLFPG